MEAIHLTRFLGWTTPRLSGVSWYVGSAGRNVRTILGFCRNAGTGRFPIVQQLRISIRIGQFLLGRKLGFRPEVRIMTRHNGRSHVWSIRERSDLSVLEEIFVRQEYRIDDLHPSVVFDLGANIGASSIYFAQTWPDAQIYAFEPNPVVFERLIDATKSYGNIYCFQYALSDADGEAAFHVSENHLSSALKPGAEPGRDLMVQTRTLRSLMNIARVSYVDLLKFDIEGAEEHLLLEYDFEHRVSAFIGEIHKLHIKKSAAELLARLSDFRTSMRAENDKYLIVFASRRS